MKRLIPILVLLILSSGCGHLLCHPTKTEQQQNVDYRECDKIAEGQEDRDAAKDECMLKRGYVRVSPFNADECKRTKED